MNRNSHARRVPALAAAAVLFFGVGAAGADPKFTFGKKEEVKDVKKVEWKASAQAGLVLTTGNSRTTTFAGGAKASRKAGNNKFIIEAGGAYAQSTVVLWNDEDGDRYVDDGELVDAESPGAKLWSVKARYDRFLTQHNSLYLSALASGDENAGKDLVAGGQVGYSRLLFKNDRHQLVSEVGYDFSYEKLISADEGVAIHSARLFTGYEGKVTKHTGVQVEVEALANVNTLDVAGEEIGPLEDTRVNGTLSLTTQLWEDISFRFGVTTKYDNAPAPLPFAFDPAATVVRAQKLDTKTEASLIINFL